VVKCIVKCIGGNESVTLKWKKDFLPEICTTLVEVYDPATSSWSLGPDLANALCGAGQSVAFYILFLIILHLR